MKDLIKLFSISAFALALAACGGSSGGSSTSSGGSSGNVSGNGGSSDNSTQNNSGDKINGLYKAFTTCENASDNEDHQTLIYRLCGEREIVFENTGNKGVLRISGAPVNWDNMNIGFMTGYYDNWKSFYVEIFMEQDEGLGLISASNNKYPYSMHLAYMNKTADANTDYTIDEKSANHHILTITAPEWDGYSPIEHVISLDILQASQPSNDTIKGFVSLGTDSKVSFTAKGKTTQNQPLLQAN